MSQPQNWDAKLYDGAHHYVTRYGEELLGLLNPQAGERILDLGCGTGHLTQQIAQAGAQVIGMDKSAEMVAAAQQTYPQLEFVVGDAADFHFDAPFDEVFSNATLHWVHAAAEAAACIYAALKPGGRFVAEFGGKGNVSRFLDAEYAVLKALGLPVPEGLPWYFPSVGEYASLLEKVGFRVLYMLHFDRPTPLEGEQGVANFTRMFTPQILDSVPEGLRADFLRQIEDRLRPQIYRDGVWYMDYVRLRLVARREN